MARSRPVILLSFDVEEFDLPLEFGRSIEPARQLDIGREGTERMLTLLEHAKARATLFVTACFASAYPDLIRRAAGQGHEIASHGLVHTGWETAHLAESKRVIEAITGMPVEGFRRARLAPTDPGEVKSAGYAYNSSDNPTWVPGRYNHFLRPRRAHRLKTGDSAGLVQIPASVTPLVRWPLFWLSFKNAPLGITKAATRAVLGVDRYAALYYHPWELCDLREFGLPGHVAGLDGDRYTQRLREYLRWLGRLGEWGTYAEFARGVH